MTQHNSTPEGKNVAVVALPFKHPGDTPPQNRPVRLASVLAASAKEVFIITGNFSIDIPRNNIKVINVRTPVVKNLKEPLFSRGFRFFLAQFTLSSAILGLSLRSSTKLDAVFFFGGEALLIPVLISKLLRKEVIFLLRSFVEKDEQARKNPFHGILGFFKRLNLVMADKIIVLAEGLISQWNLERHRNKILVAPFLFVDFEKFRPTKPLNEKANLIGYIGRFEPEKGILNFIQAMPTLLEMESDIKVVIAGDGPLRDETERYIKQADLNARVQFSGWIVHNQMPDYLNQLRLVVLPSYTEGLPNLVLEAMACGTPILATSVGAIPGMITDGETGFVMEDNSPECIVRNIIRALNHPQLDQISRNARALVEAQYSYDAAVEIYRNILANLKVKKDTAGH